MNCNFIFNEKTTETFSFRLLIKPASQTKEIMIEDKAKLVHSVSQSDNGYRVVPALSLEISQFLLYYL